MNHYTTVYDTATIDQPAPTPAAEAAKPLDFEALSRAAANLPATLDRYWPPEMRDNVFYILSLAPRLIDMAERCEAMKVGLERSFNEVMDAKDRIVAERDRLKAERALAQQCEEPCVLCAGLSKEEKEAIKESEERWPMLSKPLRDIIDRLVKAKSPPKVHWRKVGSSTKSDGNCVGVTPRGFAFGMESPAKFRDENRWTTVAELLKATMPKDVEEGRPDVLQLKAKHLDVLREFGPQKTSLGCMPEAAPKDYMQALIEADVLRWDGFQVDLTDVGKVLVERVTGKKFPQEFGQDIQTRADRAVKSLLKATMPEE
jgi:hypothetical protein